MRKSKEVQLTLLAAMALSMTACREPHRDCVDSQNHLLPDTGCQAGWGGAHYLYGGSSGGHIGDAVMGGSTSVSRGGFGGIGGGDGGGGE